MLTQLMLMVLAQAEMPTTLQPWEVPSTEVVDDTPQVFLVSSEQKSKCPKLGTVCLSPAGSSTVLGVEPVPSRMGVTVLARGTQVAARGALGAAASNQPWQVEMVARFAAPSGRGPVIVEVFDRNDRESIVANEPKVLWTLTMKPGHDIGVRFLLSPEDEFEPSHTYLVRVAQGHGEAVRVLAQGDVHLE
jgi:hypothetical protein